MPILKINNFLSTELNAHFNQIDTIEIEDKILEDGEGAFGEVYKCLTINGKPVDNEQAIKVLRLEEQKGYNTIQQLQKKIIQKNKILKSNQEIELQHYPIFKAIPQFSFEGILDGKSVKGYSANFLSKPEYDSCENVWNRKNWSNYQKEKLNTKLLLSFHLAKGFEILRGLNYIHADINPKNIFLNVNASELVIIDYDSGCITDNNQNAPTTIGKDADGEWFAPEIQHAKETKANEFKVSHDTDLWSVTVGIHHLIFGYAPLFFLEGNGATFSINSDYLTQHRWPNVKFDYENFVKNQEKRYRNYIKEVLKLDSRIQNCLSETFNPGYSQLYFRTPYHKWTEVLCDAQNLPKISFESSKTSVLGKQTITVNWEVKNAIKVFFEGQEVAEKGSRQFEIGQDTTFKLSAKNIFGKTNDELKVAFFPLPTFSIIASAENVRRGERVKFKWSATNVSNILMYDYKGTPAVNILGGNKNEFSTPELYDDCQFTFKAMGMYGEEVVKSFNINIHHPVKIVAFDVSRQLVIESHPVTFTWEVNNAQRILLNGQDVSNDRQIVLYPDKKMHYTLTAQNTFFNDFKDERSIYMNVVTLPKAPIQLAKVDVQIIGIAPPQYNSIVKRFQPSKGEIEGKLTMQERVKSWFFRAIGKFQLYKAQERKPFIELLQFIKPEQLATIIGGRNKMSTPNFTFKIDNKSITKIVRDIVQEELKNSQN